MVLICSKCEARLQLDEAKAPSRPFTVRCPKCQTSVNVQSATPTTAEPATSDPVTAPDTSQSFSRASFERPVTAPRFTPTGEESETTSASQTGALPGLNELAKLLAEAMRQCDRGRCAQLQGIIRPAWIAAKFWFVPVPSYGKSSPDHWLPRITTFSWQQGTWPRDWELPMREERMDVAFLDANF